MGIAMQDWRLSGLTRNGRHLQRNARPALAWMMSRQFEIVATHPDVEKVRQVHTVSPSQFINRKEELK